MTAPAVARSIAAQWAASNVVPRARQLLTADCPTPKAEASLLTPPSWAMADSSGDSIGLHFTFVILHASPSWVNRVGGSRL